MTFKINRVYTRSGDAGETGLVGGRRVKKSDPRVCAYGDVDELNSSLGFLKEELEKKTAELKSVIEFIQQELFDIGSELATAPEDEYPGMWKATPEHVARLETLCDRYGERLPELTSFILPGGSRVAASCHVARCVARRAERQIAVLLNDTAQKLNPEILKYVNRVSDLLFVLARWSLAQEGKSAPLWVQEKQRSLP